MRPVLRVIAGRPVLDELIGTAGHEEAEKPRDAVDVMNTAALAVLAVFGLLGLYFLVSLVFALEKVRAW